MMKEYLILVALVYGYYYSVLLVIEWPKLGCIYCTCICT